MKKFENWHNKERVVLKKDVNLPLIHLKIKPKIKGKSFFLILHKQENVKCKLAAIAH